MPIYTSAPENTVPREIVSKMNDEICQTLGKALGYPWFKDDQKNFPGATESNGVCVGDHVAETLAMEAASRIAKQQAEFETTRKELEQTKKNFDILVSDLTDVKEQVVQIVHQRPPEAIHNQLAEVLMFVYRTLDKFNDR